MDSEQHKKELELDLKFEQDIDFELLETEQI
jgi:hypothetical protein